MTMLPAAASSPLSWLKVRRLRTFVFVGDPSCRSPRSFDMLGRCRGVHAWEALLLEESAFEVGVRKSATEF